MASNGIRTRVWASYKVLIKAPLSLRSLGHSQFQGRRLKGHWTDFPGRGRLLSPSPPFTGPISLGLLCNTHCLTEAAVLMSGCGKAEVKAGLKEQLGESNLFPKLWLTLASNPVTESTFDFGGSSPEKQKQATDQAPPKSRIDVISTQALTQQTSSAAH